jgi:hypothetical protein
MTLASKFTTAVSRRGWQLGPPFVLVVVGALLFPSAGHDDTHITCWPAYTLSHFGQILNYNGDRVEQSSSLLQVLVLAVLNKLTNVDLLTLAKLSSIAFGAASVLLLFILVTRLTHRPAAFCAAMLAATSTPIVYWAFSGMETALVSFTGLLLIITAADYITGRPGASVWKPALAVSAFALVRPEAPLLIVCLLASALAVAQLHGMYADGDAVRRKAIGKRQTLLLALAALVCCGLFAFRWFYFGALVPQPATAKFPSVSIHKVVEGLHYFKRHAWNDGPATATVTLAIVLGVCVTALSQLRARTLNVYVVLSLLFAVGYVCCVVVSGGDWMEGGRFLAHFLPVAIGFIPLAVEAVSRNRWSLPVITAVLVTLQAMTVVTFAKNSSPSLPLWADVATEAGAVRGRYSWFEWHNRINVRDMQMIDQLDDVITQISSRTPGPLVLISGQMGIVPYRLALRHFGRIRFQDRFGLIERTLTDCAITRSAPRDTGGLIVSLEEYFAKLSELEQSCQIARPDLVYSLGDFTSVGAYGYREIYSQNGKVTTIGTRLTGAPVVADAFFAVDTGMLQSSGPVAARHVSFE